MSESPNEKAMVWIDGQAYEAQPGQNLLQAVLSAHLDLPYFCWHPSLGSVGACRQCAVITYADENDEQGRLSMACMTPVTDGMRLSITAPHAEEFRASVIEWLMENHPHDCPVCEEGGECHLQDMTVMTGHSARRYRDKKRTFTNQYLGPFIGHEMNRCITCYRCVRYYKDYAGGTDLQAFGSRARMYFGRESDGVLESEFSGNLVEVCPTGVFTDKPFSKDYTRKWDLRSAPSVCPGCAVGCNIFPGERYGRVKRVHNRYHGEINGYFLCDRGRFGVDFVNGTHRVRQAGLRVDDELFDAVAETEALNYFADALREGSAIGIGSARASLEDNMALQRLVGQENFSSGLSTQQQSCCSEALDVYRTSGGTIASLSDIEQADAIIVLADDVLHTAPRIALAIRQAVNQQAVALAQDAGIPDWQAAGIIDHAQGRKNPLFIASPLPTQLDDIATEFVHTSATDIAQLGFAIAHLLHEDFPSIENDKQNSQFVRDAVEALRDAERPLIVTGTGSGNADVVRAAGQIAAALAHAGSTAQLALLPLEINSFGATMLGGDLTLDSALERAASGNVSSLVVLANDLFRHADQTLIRTALAAVKHLVVLDHIDTRTANAATLVLPTAPFTEAGGTVVNYEGRAQKYFAVLPPTAPVQAAWQWLCQAGTMAERAVPEWQNQDEVLNSIAQMPGMENVCQAAPGADYRTTGGLRVPREAHRASGRTAMYADQTMHEPKTEIDPNSPLSFSMEGSNRDQPGGLLPYVWSPGWNSNQSVFKFQQEVAGPLSGGDPGVHLLKSATQAATSYPVPIGNERSSDAGFSLRPTYEIFGSEEQTALASPILERGPAPYILINPEDAQRLGSSAGSGLACEELAASFATRISESVPIGTAFISVGLSGADIALPSNNVSLRADPDYVAPGLSDDVIVRG